MIRLIPYGVGLFILITAALALYSTVYNKGAAHGETTCTKEYKSKFDELIEEKLAAKELALQAKLDQEKIAAEAGRILEEKTNEYTERVAVLEGTLTGARRQLQRLRDARATDRVIANSLKNTDATSTGSKTNGTAASPRELLNQCGERLVEMGGSADKLASQVLGLQAYVKVARKSCGGTQ